MPKLLIVDSSQVAAIGHDSTAKQLTVQFKSGGTYRYDNVTEGQHAAIMKSDSIGKALAPIKADAKKHAFKKL
jgi:hypothetical protein